MASVNHSETRSSQNKDVNSRNLGVAKARWRLLSSLLLKKHESLTGSIDRALANHRRLTPDIDSDLIDQSSISIRRFKTFGLLKSDLIPDPTNQNKNSDPFFWASISYPHLDSLLPDFTMPVRFIRETSFSFADLCGFNNTGNVCVWPSEELMTYYCMHRRLATFQGSRILELGAGMAGLTGFFLAAHMHRGSVCITDGNERSVENLRAIQERNKELLGDRVSIRQLEWGKQSSSTHKYDHIVAADCCFFDEARVSLLSTCISSLKDGGQLLMFAPSRDGTLEKFANLLRESKRFENVTIESDYDELITDLHRKFLQEKKGVYDANIHYPLLLTATRK